MAFFQYVYNLFTCEFIDHFPATPCFNHYQFLISVLRFSIEISLLLNVILLSNTLKNHFILIFSCLVPQPLNIVSVTRCSIFKHDTQYTRNIYRHNVLVCPNLHFCFSSVVPSLFNVNPSY